MVTPYRIKRLKTIEGYRERLCTHLRTSKNLKEAWEKTEKEYREAYGKARYNTHYSYKSSISRKYSKRTM